MKKFIKSLFVATLVLFAASCDLDLLESPNDVTERTANPTLVLNNIQLTYSSSPFNTLSTYGMQLTRIVSQPNVNYANAYQAQAFNGIWNASYQSILNDIAFLERFHQTTPVPRHLAYAKVFKGMLLMNLVDAFDEIPWSEALDPNNFNPVLDNGQAVYLAAFNSLQEAKALLATSTANLPQDLYYNNNVPRWNKLIGTLELKYYLNRRLVDEAGSRAAINSLIASGNLLEAGDDFAFRYGTTFNNPNSRHPRSGQLGGGGGAYQSTWYMFQLTEAKGFDDPRARYYFYRQVTSNPTDANLLRCLGELAPGHYLAGGFPFCLPDMSPSGRGYWGRDHLNNEGIPPDNFGKTLYGLYPSGTRFDNNAGAPLNSTMMGAQGAGVQPIMLAAFVDFMLAEAAQTLGTSGDPKALMISGIRKHMAYVRAFALGSAEGAVVRAFQPDANFNAAVENYVNFVSNEWDAAPAGRRMNLIAREYWLSLFGNGVEAWNLYRRTGQPDGMQPSLTLDPGLFPRSFLYPNDHVVTNRNARQKPDLGQRVFWDTNPAGNGWVN